MANSHHLFANSRGASESDAEGQRMTRHDFQITDAIGAEKKGLSDGCVGSIPSEDVSYVYTIHDTDDSRRIKRMRRSQPLHAFRAANVRPLSPSLMPIVVRDRLLAETRMFTGLEREVWDPYLYAAGGDTCVYQLPDPVVIERPTVLLPGLGSFYYHFLFDVIGGLAAIPKADWGDRLIMYTQAPHPGPVRPWQREIFSMIGAGKTHVYEGYGNHVFADAIVGSYPSQDNAVAPAVVRFLRAKLAPDEGEPRPGTRIFFTRTGARAMDEGHRRMINTLAERYGFRCVDPLQLGVRGQRQVLQNCGVFMCEAGSGLANLLFLPPGAVAITLGTKITFKDYFCPIASTLGIDSHIVLSSVTRMFPRHQFLWSNFMPGFDAAALERCFAHFGLKPRLPD